ncbi:MAG: Coq4 family protein [Henriciella sp.]|jgi:ubiquinone biosynthesis protein COQ4
MTKPVPYIDPTRPKARFRPLKAWKHMQQLLADKEDTKQVFHIIEALSGEATRKDFVRFLASESGGELLAKRRFLPDLLDNHDELRKLPKGSVAEAYIKFMEREGLTAHGLVAESMENREHQSLYDDDLLWYANRLRDTHDLYHVLTGYGRDALGEDALLGFSHSQNGGLGVSFIAFMGNRQIAKAVPREARIKDVLVEGRKHGKLAKRIADQDIIKLLSEPLEAARKRLNIKKPALYTQALNVVSELGLEPAQLAA